MPRCRLPRTTRTTTRARSSRASTTCATSRAAAASSSTISTGRSTSSTSRRRPFTTYLDFNGRGGRPGLFPKFTFERNFATGLTSFIFDPDYAKNGVFYTLHMEDPATDAPAAPKAGVVAGLDLTGYTTTPAIPTPTVDGRIDREVVLIEWTGSQSVEQHVRGHGARADAPAASAAAAPAGRDDVQSGRASRRCGLARHVPGRGRCAVRRAARQPPPEPAAARHPRRQDPPHRPRPARAREDEHRQRERALPHPERQSVRDGRRRAQGDLGLRPAQSASAGLGRRPGAATHADAPGLQHRARHLGNGRRHPQGRELRVSAARGHEEHVVHQRDGPDAGRRHHSDSDLGHRGARHGQAHLPGDPVLAQSRDGRRRHRERLRLPRQADPGAQRQARVRRHHHRSDLVRESCRGARGRRRRRRRPSHRFTRWTPSLRRIAEETYRERGGKDAGAARHGRGCRTVAASTCGLRRTTTASSTS